jgi:hypothetical protein
VFENGFIDINQILVIVNKQYGFCSHECLRESIFPYHTACRFKMSSNFAGYGEFCARPHHPVLVLYFRKSGVCWTMCRFIRQVNIFAEAFVLETHQVSGGGCIG